MAVTHLTAYRLAWDIVREPRTQLQMIQHASSEHFESRAGSAGWHNKITDPSRLEHLFLYIQEGRVGRGEKQLKVRALSGNGS